MKDHLNFDTDFLDQKEVSIEPKNNNSQPKPPKKNKVDLKAALLTMFFIVICVVYVSFTSKWVDFTSASEGFKIQFPNQPQFESDYSPVPDSTLKVQYDFYTSKEQNGTIYTVTVANYPIGEFNKVTDPQKMLDLFVNGVVSSDKNHVLLTSNPSYYHSNSSLDFDIKDSTDNSHIQGRAILIGQTLYVAMAAYTSGNNNNYQKFINSFDPEGTISDEQSIGTTPESASIETQQPEITSNSVLSDLQSTLEDSGFKTQISHDSIVWLTDDGYNVYSPSDNLKILYSPTNETSYMENPMADSNVKQMVSLVKEYLKGKLSPNVKNTYEDYDQNTDIKYSYGENDVLCAFTIGNYIPVSIEVGCTNKSEVEKAKSEIKPIYDSLVDKKDLSSTVFYIDKQSGDYYHIQEHGIAGGGAELIVKKEGNTYKQLYGGNSGDIACVRVQRYAIPEEIYSIVNTKCYEGVDLDTDQP